MSVTRIILVRHGEVEGIRPPRFPGRDDLPLTQRGVRQAELTRDYLRLLAPVAAIYTSPLARCQHTAQIIAAPHDTSPVPLPELTDIDYGDWQGHLYDEIKQRDPQRFKEWMTRPDKAQIPGGEDLLAADRRSSRAWGAVIAQHREATVVLVSHSSTNRLLLLNVLHLPLLYYWKLTQSPCGVSTITHDGTLWKITNMNETAHLLGAGQDVASLASAATDEGVVSEGSRKREPARD